jgi:hypothetical protein
MCRRLFGAHWGQELWERVRAGRWEQVEQDRALLRRSCRRAALNTAPWWWAGEGPRVAERWFRPTGLLLAVLGPDGAGKATLAQKIVEDAGPVFRRVARVHFRPRRLHPGDPEASSRPHATPSYGFLRSLAKLVLYLADWWLGYLADIRPALARSTLVVCDRAYHDILVDPLRYRYGGTRVAGPRSWAVRAEAGPRADPGRARRGAGHTQARATRHRSSATAHRLPQSGPMAPIGTGGRRAGLPRRGVHASLACGPRAAIRA